MNGNERANEACATVVGRAVGWAEAHVTLEAALEGLPERLRGVRPPGLPHSPWELLEHVRIAQADLLAYATDPAYRAPTWPDEYWPEQPEPPARASWDESIAAYARDRDALSELATAALADATARIPWAEHDDHTTLRAVLLSLDHTAYHVGQVVLVRRALGAWPPPEAAG
jgi:hypothetical protein